MHLSPQTIIALHGFLGHPSDFDGFAELDLQAVDLSEFNSLSLNDFASEFNRSIQGNENILLGYSMGGRLSLHCLIHSPHKWKAAIIISGGPGLICDIERAERIKSDLQLLERFESGSDDFDTLIQEWNKQPLFNQTLPHQKQEKLKIHNRSLKQGLTSWSLGTQEDLREAISKLPMPILWIVGEKDTKYCKLTEPLKFLNSKSRVWIAENSFHRVPWEVKTEFQNQVNAFLTSLKEVL